MEQYLAFVGGKPLAQIVSPTQPAQLAAKPVPQPVPQPALPPGPTQKEKDALVASLAAQKDTFPIDKLIKCPMCQKTFDDPRTLLCLHSFCLGCLEAQQFTAKSQSSDLRCHQCSAPFTLPGLSGVALFSCNSFIDSLVKSAKANQGDINRVIKCDFCQDNDATMHCVECSENFCPSCSGGHKRGKATAAHQQIPLEDALAGNATVKRIPRCQKHIGTEINTYCKTCNDAVCSMCAVEKHSGHSFCPLSQVTGPLQDQIAGYTITITKREEEARKAIDTLDGTINKIEDHRSTAEKDIASLFASIHTTVDARHAQVLQQMQDKGNQLRKTAIQEKGEVESATVQFREFHSFTEGLLAQGTPLEIAGTHKMVQTRNETLEKLQFPKQASVSPVFKFSAGNVDEVKKAISTIGSIVSQ